MSCRKAMECFKQLVDGVLYLQEKGICHRNLNSSNVFVDRKYADFDINLKISDYCSAVFVTDDETIDSNEPALETSE